MLSAEMNQDLGTSFAPVEAKKNEFNPYQDNGGYVSSNIFPRRSFVARLWP